MKARALSCSLILLVAGIGSASAAEWQVKDEGSSVKFTFTEQGTKYTGQFEEFKASIDIDPSAVEKGTIVGTVQTGSVNSRDYDRDASMKEPEWFDVDEYPEAQFESESITKQADGSYKASGNLTLKGTTRPVDLNFKFNAENGSLAEFMGTMKLDRFDFDVGEGWNDTSWVGQDVDVTIDLHLTMAGS